LINVLNEGGASGTLPPGVFVDVGVEVKVDVGVIVEVAENVGLGVEVPVGIWVVGL
jgi:hypothetical protein